ncbi:MAG: hypothetical protein M3R38_29605 [Actinomycetota bacterium]|nr:hypothetical protein [Actinomycetota bacterium]
MSAMEGRLPEIHELPYEDAFEILTKKRGYSAERADEIIAISRGESSGDIHFDYGDDD